MRSNTDAQMHIVSEKDKVSLVSKIAYGMGDASSTLLRMVIFTYLTFFYTEVAGLNAAAVGTMMLVARVADLVSSPVIGYFVDQTHSKRGKCRPWFLVDAVPLGIFGALCFFSPNLSGGAKLAFAYVTYIGYIIFANMLQIPMGAILSNMTSDSYERTKVNSVRMTFGQVAGAISALITVPLISFLGNGNDAQGYARTAILYGIFATVCVLFCYFKIRENVSEENNQTAKISPKNEHHGLKFTIKTLTSNLPLFLLLVISFANSTLSSMGNSGLLYYLKYVIGDISIMPTASLLNYLGILVVVSVPWLNKKFSKRNIMLAGYLLMIIGRGIIVLMPSVFTLYLGLALVGISSGFGIGLIYSMVADTVDFGEFNTGVRAQGLAYSLVTLCEGIAGGLASAFVGYILAMGGYVGGTDTQSASSITAINTVFLYVPIICSVIIVLALVFYRLDSKMPDI